MCGIYFFTKNSLISKENIKKNLKHRGPDYNGQVDLKHSIIGFNLLSIREKIDFSKQPMITENENFIIAFNGEIYNTDKLKKQFNFKVSSDSDSEILNRLVNLKGLDFIKYIKGMYAIILYDKNNKLVHAYRDKSGQKNLYYLEGCEFFIISSEIHTLFESRILKKKVNYNSIYEACVVGYNPNENTIFSNIKKLLPGQKIEYNPFKNEIIKNFYEQKDNHFENATLYESIDETIKNHLLSKSKIAINISGGLDSNIILHHSLKYKPEINLFCTYFEGANEEYNYDYKIASKIGKKFGLKVIKTNVTERDYVEKFYDSYSLIEEPNRNIGNPGYYINYINQSSLGFRSVLTGDGGDEIFVGYPWYRRGRFRELIYKYSYLLKLFRFPEINNYYDNYERYNSCKKFKDFFIFNKNQFSKKKLLNISKNNFESFLESSHQLKDVISWDKNKLILDQFNWLSSEVLIRADKLSMRQSLEIRNPFCDYDLRIKMLKDLNNLNFKSSINKKQIRDIYKTILPSEVVGEKKKYGWRCPHNWMSNKLLKEQLIDLIPKTNSAFFNWNFVKESLINNKISLMDRSVAPIISLVILNDYHKLDM